RYGYSVWLIHRRLDAWSAVAFVALFAAACHRGDNAGCGVDFADTVVERLRDEQVAVPIDRAVKRLIQLRIRGFAAVAAVAGLARPGGGGDDEFRGVRTAQD